MNLLQETTDMLTACDKTWDDVLKSIRLIELFGGIGSQAMALRDIRADFEHYRLVEFDKYACASYNAIHGTSFEPTDIRNVHGGDLGIVNKDRFCYLLTYSFPCQSLSVAGKMEGMSKADWESRKSTKSGLLWEVERILKELPKECLPDILLMENVTQVHAKKNLSDFESWQSFLRGRGYQNFYADLNARDFGIPQNRKRCFMVSILSDEHVDFKFPEKIELETMMRDYLEESVDEKYYINSEKAEKLIRQLIESGVLEDSNIEDVKTTRGADVVSTIRASYYKTGERNIRENIMSGRGYEGVIEIQKDNLVMEKNIVIDIYNNKIIDGEVCGTITANGNTSSTHCGTFGIVEKEKINKVGQISNEGSQFCTRYRIRRLIPRECWRLMGYTDEDFDKAAAVNSNTQLYKQAGNAIVKQVLMAVFRQLKLKTKAEDFIKGVTNEV